MKKKAKIKILIAVLALLTVLVPLVQEIISSLRSEPAEPAASPDTGGPVIINNPEDPTIVIQNSDGDVIINIGKNDTDDPSPQTLPDEIPENMEQRETFTVGWWDNIGGRAEYTIEEINNGAIDDKIVFNSIKDSVIGHEFNFVAARINSGINGRNVIWNANEIEAEEGKTYLVRIYAHNNSRFGYAAVAKDVSVRFKISNTVAVLKDDLHLDGFDGTNGYYGVAINGYINASNATPSEYSDGVKFVSNRPFHLEYIPGTAEIVTNKLSCGLRDEIMDTGVLIGYDELNGEVPGCYQYDSYIGIKVMPVFDD